MRTSWEPEYCVISGGADLEREYGGCEKHGDCTLVALLIESGIVFNHATFEQLETLEERLSEAEERFGTRENLAISATVGDREIVARHVLVDPDEYGCIYEPDETDLVGEGVVPTFYPN